MLDKKSNEPHFDKGSSNNSVSPNYSIVSPIDRIHEEINRIGMSTWVSQRYGVRVVERYGKFKLACVVHHGEDLNAQISEYRGKWWYRCWSQCGQSWDVIGLVQATGEARDVVEAIELLSDDLGLS